MSSFVVLTTKGSKQEIAINIGRIDSCKDYEVWLTGSTEKIEVSQDLKTILVRIDCASGLAATAAFLFNKDGTSVHGG